MNRAALNAALDRAAVMASDRTHIVKMSFVPGQVTLAADTPDVGNSKDSLPIHYEGEAFNIAFNYQFIQHALKVMDGEEVVMETNGSLAPTLFKDDLDLEAYLCLVMPVQAK
jgi:DNA polymerase-3 subunit beta